MNPAWSGALALGALAALLGFAWHWAAAAAVLAAGLALHSAQLAGFLRWLRRPAREALPAGRGAWEEAFAALHRLFKARDEERDP